jgi:hypothetical protein
MTSTAAAMTLFMETYKAGAHDGQSSYPATTCVPPCDMVVVAIERKWNEVSGGSGGSVDRMTAEKQKGFIRNQSDGYPTGGRDTASEKRVSSKNAVSLPSVHVQ